MSEQKYLCWMNVCENDNNGNPSGKANCIEFGEVLRFESDDFNGYAFNTHKKDQYNILRLSGRKYPYRGFKSWFGNMAWNAYQIDTITANQIINQLIQSGKWSIVEGDSELSDMIEKDKCILHGDLIRVWKSYEQTEYSH